jgi:hypothetical protein
MNLDILNQIKTKVDELNRLLDELTGEQTTNKYHVASLDYYVSQSGYPTWKLYDEKKNQICRLRTAQKQLLVDSGIWQWLNSLEVTDSILCDFDIEIVPDGRFKKVVKIDFDQLKNQP